MDDPHDATRTHAPLLMLALVLAVCAVPMLVGIGARDTTHTMENVALVVSQESWLRADAGDASAWLLTTNDARPRLEKPPMLTWLHGLAWLGLDPATTDPDRLVTRARLVAVALGLVVLTATFWIGHTLGGTRMAVMSALVAGSIFFLQRQARTASYDIHLVAWATLSVASALWAMTARDGPRGRGRRLVGWLLAGLALAASVMSKNPLAVVLVALPVGAALVLLPGRTAPRVAGLAAALGLALVLSAPWYAWVALEVEGAGRRLAGEFRQAREDPQPVHYYVGLLGLVAPWSLFLVAGLVHPFMPAIRSARRTALVAWLWLALLLVMLSIPEAKQQRYILPAIPAVALLIGRVFTDHETMAARGLRDRALPWIIWTHWILLVVASVLACALLAEPARIAGAVAAWQHDLESSLAARGVTDGWRWRLATSDDWPDTPIVGAIPWPAALAIGAALTALAVTGLVTHLRRRPMRAGVITAAWTLVALAAFWHGYGRAPSAVHPLREETRALAARLGDAPIRSLRAVTADRRRVMLNEEFRFYLGRLVLPVFPETLADDLDRGDGPVYVLARDRPRETRLLRRAGLADEGLVRTDRNASMRLWIATPTAGDQADPSP